MASKKLSIGFVIDTNLDSNDGVQQYVKRLGSWLSSQGHQVQYLTSDSKIKEWSGGRVYSLARKVTVKFNANRVTMPLWPRPSQINQAIKSNNFDILHVQLPYSPLLAQRIINKADNKTAVVGTFHILPTNQLQTTGTKFLKLIYGRSLKRFDGFISVSPAAAVFASKMLGINSEVIPNPVDVADFALSKPMPHGSKKKIVFLGRLVERKGAQWLLSAVMLLAQKLPELEVVIAGEGPMRSELESFVKKNKLEDVVSFIGFVDEADKPTLLNSANVACFPAMHGESFGIVIIEAMAAGSGVILAGDNPGYRSVLGNQPEMLINSYDAHAFAERLYRLLTVKKLSARLHEWQNQEVGKYDTSVVGLSTLYIYNRAIAKRGNS